MHGDVSRIITPELFFFPLTLYMCKSCAFGYEHFHSDDDRQLSAVFGHIMCRHVAAELLC